MSELQKFPYLNISYLHGNKQEIPEYSHTQSEFSYQSTDLPLFRDSLPKSR